MIGLLAFGPVDSVAKRRDPASLLASAREWLDLAGQDFLDASMAAKLGDKPVAIKLLRSAELRSAAARADLEEATGIEAGPS